MDMYWFSIAYSYDSDIIFIHAYRKIGIKIQLPCLWKKNFIEKLEQRPHFRQHPTVYPAWKSILCRKG